MYITYHYLGEYPDSVLKYFVMVSRYEGKWVFCRHKKRNTWEIPGGHIEKGESALDAAKRELFEETGAADFSLTPVKIYAVRSGEEKTLGMLYFAEIHTLEKIPAEMEIAEISFLADMPEALTYPLIQPYLFAYVKAFLTPKQAREEDELWDVYDEYRVKTGRTHPRGKLIPDGDYHLVVHVCVQNGEGKILLTQRSPNKGFPHKWEWTGGSALAGEDSLSAAIRELQEETGIVARAEHGTLLETMRRMNDFVDLWLFHEDFDLSDVKLQEGETCAARLVTVGELLEMAKNEELAPYSYLENFILKIKNNINFGGHYGNSDS